MKPKWKTEVPTNKFLLKIKDVSKILEIDPERIRKMMIHRIIPSIKIGSVWYTDRDKLGAWLTSLYTDRYESTINATDGKQSGEQTP